MGRRLWICTKKNGFVVVERLLDAELIERRVERSRRSSPPRSFSTVAELEPSDASVARRIWSPTKRHKLFEELAADPGCST